MVIGQGDKGHVIEVPCPAIAEFGPPWCRRNPFFPLFTCNGQAKIGKRCPDQEVFGMIVVILKLTVVGGWIIKLRIIQPVSIAVKIGTGNKQIKAVLKNISIGQTTLFSVMTGQLARKFESLIIGAVFSDEIDDREKGIAAIQCRTRPANDLNFLDQIDITIKSFRRPSESLMFSLMR